MLRPQLLDARSTTTDRVATKMLMNDRPVATGSRGPADTTGQATPTAIARRLAPLIGLGPGFPLPETRPPAFVAKWNGSGVGAYGRRPQTWQHLGRSDCAS